MAQRDELARHLHSNFVDSHEHDGNTDVSDNVRFNRDDIDAICHFVPSGLKHHQR